MTAAAEIAGPVGYDTRWWVLAVGLLAVALAWNLGVLLWGRPRRVRAAAAHRPDVAVLRERYLGLVDAVEREHAGGRIGPREAHRRLSALSRSYVDEATGRRTRAMTLADLRGEDPAGLSGLVEVVAAAYPPAFGRDEAPWEGSVPEAAERARATVRTAPPAAVGGRGAGWS